MPWIKISLSSLSYHAAGGGVGISQGVGITSAVCRSRVPKGKEARQTASLTLSLVLT